MSGINNCNVTVNTGPTEDQTTIALSLHEVLLKQLEVLGISQSNLKPVTEVTGIKMVGSENPTVTNGYIQGCDTGILVENTNSASITGSHIDGRK